MDQAFADLIGPETLSEAPVSFATSRFAALPDEIGLRLLGRIIDGVGDEGPVELGKLEALFAAVQAAIREDRRLRRTLAGATVTVDRETVTIGRAPARRSAVRRPKP